MDLILAEIRDNSEKQKKIYEYRDVHPNKKISYNWKKNETLYSRIIPKMYFQQVQEICTVYNILKIKMEEENIYLSSTYICKQKQWQNFKKKLLPFGKMREQIKEDKYESQTFLNLFHLIVLTRGTFKYSM